jgi:pimeloyl-ACP methyl ester carboxylesterase
VACLVQELLDELDLHEVTVVGNDTGGSVVQLLMNGVRPLRRLPIAFGWLTRTGDRAVARCLNPVLTLSEIRRDTVRVLRAIPAEPELMLRAAEKLPGFDRPALVVWASEDRVMPPEHGRRLAELLPQGRLVEIPDSYTLIPLDQPTGLARAIREFTQGG